MALSLFPANQLNTGTSIPAPPAHPVPTGNASNDAILKRLHTIEVLLIKNMQHTELLITAAVDLILKAQKAPHR